MLTFTLFKFQVRNQPIKRVINYKKSIQFDVHYKELLFFFLIQQLIEARAKKCTNFRGVFGVYGRTWYFCFQDLLTFGE